MEKETKKSASHLPFPPSGPFAMGVPFPIFHPQMRQFIPMGMIPIDGDIQQFMGAMTKNGLHSMPMYDSLNSLQQLNQRHSDSSEASERTERFLPSNNEENNNSFNSSLIEKDDTKEYGSVYPPMVPVMPSFVVFPYFGAVPGYLPGYSQFNSHPFPKHSKMSPKDSEDQHHKRQEDRLEKNFQSGSDELDVAQILVNMHIPILKQVSSSVLSPNITVSTDQNSSESSNQVLEIQEGSSHDNTEVEMIDFSSNQNDETNAEGNNQEVQNPEKIIVNESMINTSINEVATEVTDVSVHLAEVKKEDSSIQQQGALKEPENNILQVEIKTENKNEQEMLEKELHLENEVQTIPSICSEDNDSVDLQDEEGATKHFHELQCVKSNDLNTCSQPCSKEFEAPVCFDADPSIDCDESNVTTHPTDEGEHISQQDQTDMNKAQTTDVDMETNNELLAEGCAEGDPNGQKMTYKCEVCSQLFRSPLGLQKHIEFHTDNGKQYTCSICFEHFQSETNLQTHLDSHMRKRPHKCSFCSKAFRDPGSLQKHVRVHTGEKPYNCKDCYKSFAEYSSLRKHQRVHTGERPYKCQYCSKAFSISGNLQRHILIHTGERPYKCNFCPKAFNNPSHLRRHVKNLHFKGESFIDEAMLSHYGNTGVKPNDTDCGVSDSEAKKHTVLQDTNNLDLSEISCTNQV